MHVLFECARRWELVSTNPIELVRQSGRRQKLPKRLTTEELRRLLAQLEQPYSTMVILAACLGLRVGEILGLQWGDVDLLHGTLDVHRSVYHTTSDRRRRLAQRQRCHWHRNSFPRWPTG